MFEENKKKNCDDDDDGNDAITSRVWVKENRAAVKLFRFYRYLSAENEIYKVEIADAAH